MTRILLAMTIVLLGASVQNMAPVTAPTPPGMHPPQSLAVDDTFAIAATQGGNAEIGAARLAIARSKSDEVVSFARTMLVDHGDIDKEGMPLIRPHLVRPPLSLSPPDELGVDYLRTLPPVDFDQQYAMMQIGDHLATMTAFATEARDGADPTLKAFAKKWLPTIQAHLQLAVTLVKHVGGDTSFKQ